MPRAWNDWFHCTTHFYGQWLPGCDRGWRTRHHRKHVPFDYKHPTPKGGHAGLLLRSKRLLKRPPIVLPLALRDPLLDEVLLHLTSLDVLVVAACLNPTHLHLLAKFAGDDPRLALGRAKHAATKRLRAITDDPTHEAHGLAVGLNLALGASLWSKRSRAEPITDRGHQLDTIRYILNHRSQRAVTRLFHASPAGALASV